MFLCWIFSLTCCCSLRLWTERFVEPVESTCSFLSEHTTSFSCCRPFWRRDDVQPSFSLNRVWTVKKKKRHKSKDINRRLHSVLDDSGWRARRAFSRDVVEFNFSSWHLKNSLWSKVEDFMTGKNVYKTSKKPSFSSGRQVFSGASQQNSWFSIF